MSERLSGEVANLDLQKHKFDKADRNSISIENTKNEIDKKVKDNWLSLLEIKVITEMYKKSDKLSGKQEIRDYINELLKNDTINNIQKLKNEIENIDPQFGFNNLADSFQNKNIIQKQLINLFNDIIPEKILSDFSIKEQDNLKFVLIDIFQKEGIFNLKFSKVELKELSSISKEDIKKLDGFKGKPEELVKYLNNSPLSIFNKLGKALGKIAPYIKKIEKIHETKIKENKDYSDIHIIYNYLGINEYDGKKQKDIFLEVKSVLHKKMDKFTKVDGINDKDTKKIMSSKNVKDKIKNAQEKLAGTTESNSNGESLKDKINEMFPGKDLLSRLLKMLMMFLSGISIGVEGKFPKKSLKNLKEYSVSSDSVLKGKMKEEDLIKLEKDPEKLKKFNEYLKNKGIDSTQKDFWKKILTGKGTKTGDKLNNLYKKLLGSEKVILGPKEGIDELLLKLNSLTKTTEKKDVKKEKQKETK